MHQDSLKNISQTPVTPVKGDTGLRWSHEGFGSSFLLKIAFQEEVQERGWGGEEPPLFSLGR